MFGLFSKSEEEAMQEQADKQQDFVKHQDLVNSSLGTDDTFHQEGGKRNELIKWQEDLSDELMAVVRRLKRIAKNSKGEWVPEQEFMGYDPEGREVWREVKPMLNDKGVLWFVQRASPLLSRNLMMSNYDESMIGVHLNSTAQDFIIELRNNFYIFDVNKEDFKTVIRLFKDLVRPTFYRCLNNGERKYSGMIHKLVETRAETVQAAKSNRGFMGFLGGA